MSSSCLSGPYAVLTKDTMPQTYKRKRSWSRAVFSNLQRKGLEKRFEIQKYVTKPDRKQLAAMLGLTDAQVRSRSSTDHKKRDYSGAQACKIIRFLCSVRVQINYFLLFECFIHVYALI